MTKRPAFSTNAPAWEDFESAEVNVRRGWLSYIDICFDKIFLEELNESAFDDQKIEEYIERWNSHKAYGKAQLSDLERDALLLGMTSPLAQADRWKQLATVIREHGTSIELNEILSDMIEYGGFHPRAKFESIDQTSDDDLKIYNQYLYICELLRSIYPEKDERAILPRARAVAAHFVAEDDTESSVAETGLKIRRLTQGLETRVERTKLRLLRARVEKGDRLMPIPCRVYPRKKGTRV